MSRQFDELVDADQHRSLHQIDLSGLRTPINVAEISAVSQNLNLVVKRHPTIPKLRRELMDPERFEFMSRNNR